MLKVLNVFVCIAVLFCVALASTEQIRTHILLKHFENVEAYQQKVTDAQEYSQPLAKAVADLANENSQLVTVLEKAKQVIDALAEENTTLKKSLNESVEQLVTANAQINALMAEVEKLEFQVKTLQAALDLLAPPIPSENL